MILGATKAMNKNKSCFALKDCLSEELKQHFGYYLLLVGDGDLSEIAVIESPTLRHFQMFYSDMAINKNYLKANPIEVGASLIGQLDALPFCPGELDIVVADIDFKSKKNPLLSVFFKEVYTALRPEGVFIYLLKNNISNVFIFKKCFIFGFIFGFIQTWLIKKKLKKAGFDDCKISQFGKKKIFSFENFKKPKSKNNIFGLMYVAKKQVMKPVIKHFDLFEVGDKGLEPLKVNRALNE